MVGGRRSDRAELLKVLIGFITRRAAPLPVLLLAVSVASAADMAVAAGNTAPSAGPLARGNVEIPVKLETMTVLRASTLGEWTAEQASLASGARASRDCDPVVWTYSEVDWSGGEFVAQAGFVADEIAAASYTVDASHFPVHVTDMEMIFVQPATEVTTTTHWSVLVWEGTPDSGTLVASFSSDDEILPHLVFGPSSQDQGTIVVVTVDPEDPEQIFVSDDGSHTFSIGFRIDQHNNPPTEDCNCILGTCFTPAECCPPDPASNAFPSTDTLDPPPDFLADNWLYCRPGCDPYGVGAACPGGWHSFSTLGAFCPSGDWNIRVTYTPFECAGFGACCLEDPAACESLDETNCTGQGGTWQGEGVGCSPNPCPGACCAADQSCTGDVLEATCEDPGYAFFQGQSCGQVTCPEPIGACCDFSTETCLPDLTEALCTAGDGVYQGHDTICAEVDCTMATGACCLDPGCLEVDATFCAIDLGGAYAGDETTCPEACDSGACCLGGLCVPAQSEANCASALGQWQGPLSECVPNPCCAGPVDLDCDGDVDLADFVVFVGCLAGPDTAPLPDCSEADLDGDQDVDLADYQVFAIEYAAGQ